mgnify:CR=1 FL=1
MGPARTEVPETQCRRLTHRSSGHAPACRSRPSFHSGPSTSCRRVPLSSNVRPRMNGCLQREGRNPRPTQSETPLGRVALSVHEQQRSPQQPLKSRLGSVAQAPKNKQLQVQVCSATPKRIATDRENTLGHSLARSPLQRLRQGSRCAAQTCRPPGPATQSSPAKAQGSTPWPNRSLERTATGKALGPRGGQWHHSPRGPSTLPVAAAQLQR